jgi:hypothetical protein
MAQWTDIADLFQTFQSPRADRPFHPSRHLRFLSTPYGDAEALDYWNRWLDLIRLCLMVTSSVRVFLRLWLF